MYNSKRNFVWLFNDIDDIHVNIPLQNGVKLRPDQVMDTFLPRFFTINGPDRISLCSCERKCSTRSYWRAGADPLLERRTGGPFAAYPR